MVWMEGVVVLMGEQHTRATLLSSFVVCRTSVISAYALSHLHAPPSSLTRLCQWYSSASFAQKPAGS